MNMERCHPFYYKNPVCCKCCQQFPRNGLKNDIKGTRRTVYGTFNKKASNTPSSSRAYFSPRYLRNLNELQNRIHPDYLDIINKFVMDKIYQLSNNENLNIDDKLSAMTDLIRKSKISGLVNYSHLSEVKNQISNQAKADTLPTSTKSGQNTVKGVSLPQSKQKSKNLQKTPHTNKSSRTKPLSGDSAKKDNKLLKKQDKSEQNSYKMEKWKYELEKKKLKPEKDENKSKMQLSEKILSKRAHELGLMEAHEVCPYNGKIDIRYPYTECCHDNPYFDGRALRKPARFLNTQPICPSSDKRYYSDSQCAHIEKCNAPTFMTKSHPQCQQQINYPPKNLQRPQSNCRKTGPVAKL